MRTSIADKNKILELTNEWHVREYNVLSSKLKLRRTEC